MKVLICSFGSFYETESRKIQVSECKMGQRQDWRWCEGIVLKVLVFNFTGSNQPHRTAGRDRGDKQLRLRRYKCEHADSRRQSLRTRASTGFSPAQCHYSLHHRYPVPLQPPPVRLDIRGSQTLYPSGSSDLSCPRNKSPCVRAPRKCVFVLLLKLLGTSSHCK